MKLLLTGSNEKGSLERYYLRHLKELGIDVHVFAAQSLFYAYYERNIWNKLLYKAGISSIGQEIDKQMRAVTEEIKPDIIWVFKGMEVTPSYLEWARKRGIKLVNYNPDNPFIFSGRGSGNSNVTASIGLYDLHFTYDQVVLNQISKVYNLPVYLLPFGFELDDTLYDEYTKQEEILRLCFLGNPDKDRASFISQMAETIPVDVYGHHWNRYISHRNVNIFQPKYEADFWRVLYRYRVQLNLMRRHNTNSHNMRTFEVPGVGGIGLFPDTPDHRQFFNNGKEVFLYNGIKESTDKAAHLLNLSFADAMDIREQARKRSLQSGYSYKDRAQQVFTALYSTFS